MGTNKLQVIGGQTASRLAIPQEKGFYRSSAKTAIAVFKSELPNIAGITKKHGEQTVTDLLTIMVEDVADFYNVGKNFNGKQLLTTVELIIECYPYFKLDDFGICFRNGMKGFYGKAFDRLDGNVLLEWLDKYDGERSASIEELRRNEAKTLERELSAPLAEPVELPKEIKDFINRPPDNRRKEIKPPADIANPIKEILVDKAKRDVERWDRQFNNLYYNYKKLSVNLGGMRFLKIGGVNMGLQEFLRWKMERRR